MSEKAPDWQDKPLEGVPEGERNSTATSLAGRWFGKGHSGKEVLFFFQTWNQKNIPPLPERELEEIVKSIGDTHKRNHPALSSNKREDAPKVCYRLTTLADVFAYPEPTYLIEPVLIEGTISILGAYTGVGKSLISLVNH